MSLGLFNCRLIQAAGDQLFAQRQFRPLFRLLLTRPARQTRGGRRMLLVFPSQKVLVLVSAGTPVGRRRSAPADSPANLPNPTHRFCYRAVFSIGVRPFPGALSRAKQGAALPCRGPGLIRADYSNRCELCVFDVDPLTGALQPRLIEGRTTANQLGLAFAAGMNIALHPRLSIRPERYRVQIGAGLHF